MISQTIRKNNSQEHKSEKWVVVVDHFDASVDIINNIKALGFNVAFIGESKLLQAASDLVFDLNPSKNLDLVLKECLPQLRELDVLGTYSAIEQAKYCESVIGAELDVKHLSSKTLLAGRDKYKFRCAVSNSTFSKINYHFIPDQVPHPTPQLSFPFIAKPNVGFASTGVYLVRNLFEFNRTVNAIRRLNKFVLKTSLPSSLGVLCEEYIDGPEISVDSLTVDGTTRVICICEKRFPRYANFQDHIYYVSPTVFEAHYASIEKLISEMLSALEYTSGPAHTELRYNTFTNEWVVLETAFRVGAGGCIGQLIQETTGIPYNELAIRSWLEILPLYELNSLTPLPQRCGCFYVPSSGEGGKIIQLHGIEFLKTDPRIKYFYFLKNVGDILVPYPRGVDYLAVIVAVEETLDDLEELLVDLQAVKVTYYSDT